MDINRDWIGKGIKVPELFNKVSGDINTNSGSDRIKQSIYYILTTIQGERFFLPEFGSKLHLLVFEPNDLILRDLVQVYIKDALRKWEPRIQVLSVTCANEYDNILYVDIHYLIKATNMQENYVFPFNRNPMDLERQ